MARTAKANVITSKTITSDHALSKECWNSDGCERYIGRQGFNISDILRASHPEMYSNPKIAPHLEKGANVPYYLVNYRLNFTEDIFDNNAWGVFGRHCGKCTDTYSYCSDDTIKSFCNFTNSERDQKIDTNFFVNSSPSLVIRESNEIPVIKAKQVGPPILLDRSGYMIDTEGNNTYLLYYGGLKRYLEFDNSMKDDCRGQPSSACEYWKKIMKRVAWDNKEELELKVSDNTEETCPCPACSRGTDGQDIPAFADLIAI